MTEGRPRLTLRGPGEVSSVREWVRGAARSWDIGHAIVDDLVVCVSEAVTNAIVHAGGEPVSVRVARTATGVRVEVADGTPQRLRVLVPAEAWNPTPAVAELDEHGRGLFLLGALASRWGVAVEPPTGKRVWFELDAPAPVPALAPVAVVGALR